MQFTLKTPNLVVATWPYRNDYTWLDVFRNGKSFTPQVYGGQPRYYCNDVGETTNALGLAAVGDKLYLAMNYDNNLMVVDAAKNGNDATYSTDSPYSGHQSLFAGGLHASDFSSGGLQLS